MIPSRVDEIFHAVADLAPESRQRYFAQHNIDKETRSEVEALVLFDRGCSTTLERNIGRVAESALAPVDRKGLLCGSYRLGDFLGSGGMGTVYLAERVDGEIAQRAAVKLLAPGADNPHLRQRFLAERQILASLSHPHIARLLDAGHREDGQPYLVMEYVAGKTIDAYTRGFGIRRKIALFLKVCSAVSYLHRNLVVHHDLKPANILVTEDGEPKLLDFGIAKMLDLSAGSAVTGIRMLTPDYASPEQLAGGAVSTATDIYSLGAVLYQLLTDKPPRRDQADSASSGRITLSSGLTPGLKGDLAVILRKALRKDPLERYSAIDQFSEDLENYLASRPIRARKSDAWYRTRKFLERYWLPAAALFIAITAMTVGLLVVHHQRYIAARRFAEVRRVADQLFTLENEIRTLPGSTAARERIVKIALEYLEHLSKDAGNDLVLKTEIAQAYSKVARIQGVYRSINLGRPAEARASLQHAQAFFRDVWKAHPAGAAAFRSFLESVELEARIDYGQLDIPGVRRTLEELRALTPRYESLAPANLDEWDFLGGIYQTMALAASRLDRRDEGLGFAARSVQYQRRAAAVSSELRFLGNLSGSLATYAAMQRAAGDLDGALQSKQEAIRIAERLAAQYPNDNRGRLNLAAEYCDLAVVYAEENGISFGNRTEAIRWYERSLDLNRKNLQADPREQQARRNTAHAARMFADVVRHTDPARAAALYDEAIGLLRAMPAKTKARDVELGIVLAESTFPLRTLRRYAEARARLAEASRIAEATADVSPDSPQMPMEAVSRAEADWALASHRPLEAATAHQAWLERLHFGADTVRNDLHSAIVFGIRYELLRDAYRRAGRLDLATQANARRQAILEFWQKKLPAASRIAWSCCAISGPAQTRTTAPAATSSTL